jgi:predicted transcriptional regulator
MAKLNAVELAAEIVAAFVSNNPLRTRMPSRVGIASAFDSEMTTSRFMPVSVT